MSTDKSKITLRFLAQPDDVNFAGNVHGGMAMKWLDEAGYVCATAWSSSYCVTAFVGDINFHEPIPIGNIVEVYARVIHTGRTSMSVAVDLYHCHPAHCELSRAIHCIMVFVAVDDTHKPKPVPAWQPESESDKLLEEYAIRIRKARKKNEEELASLRNG